MKNILPGIIGVLIASMVLLNGALAAVTGNLSSSIIIHISGLIVVTLIVLYKKSSLLPSKHLSPIWYFGGMIGALTVLFNNIGFSVLGVSLTMAMGLLGQILMSLMIDHFGWFGLEIKRFKWTNLIGLCLIVTGIWVMSLAA